jgi:hypothetical protein
VPRRSASPLAKLLVATVPTSREGTHAASFSIFHYSGDCYASIQEIVMQVERQFIEVKQCQVVIELPASFINHRVEVIALTVDEDEPELLKRRRPHPEIAGKGRTLGDLISPVVDDADWECLK